MTIFSRTLLAAAVALALALAIFPATPKDITFVPAISRALPNDCAITATEVYRRLQASGVPARLFSVTYINDSGEVSGHMVTVWQPFRGSNVLLYDLYFIEGTYEFASVRALDCNRLADAFSRTWQFKRKAQLLLDAHFVQ